MIVRKNGIAELDARLDMIEGIDEEIIYRDSTNMGSPYTYIIKILGLNKDRLCAMHRLFRLNFNSVAQTFQIQALEAQQVKDALHSIVIMLQQPVVSFCIDPKEIITMRILKNCKKEFSKETGCWLHFKWPSRVISVYGIEGAAASAYVCTLLGELRSCIANEGVGRNGRQLMEHMFDRRYKTLIKKYVEYIETRSGAQLVILSDKTEAGYMIVQFYGQKAKIAAALNVISEEVLVLPTTTTGPCPAKVCCPGEIVSPKEFQSRQQQQQQQQQRAVAANPTADQHPRGQRLPHYLIEQQQQQQQQQQLQAHQWQHFDSIQQQLLTQVISEYHQQQGNETIIHHSPVPEIETTVKFATDTDCEQGAQSPHAGLDAGTLREMARMRGPGMQLGNSKSLPNLPVGLVQARNAPEPDDSHLYAQLIKKQNMGNVLQVVNGAGVDLRWVIKLLKEVGKSSLPLEVVMQMLEKSVAVQQFQDFEDH